MLIECQERPRQSTCFWVSNHGRRREYENRHILIVNLGLIPPTGGIAVINGKSIDEISEIRKFIGVSSRS